MTSEEGSMPHGWRHVRSLMATCQKRAFDSSQGSLVEALTSLHTELLRMRSSSSSLRKQENNLVTSDSYQRIDCSSPVVHFEDDDWTEYEFLYTIAEDLVGLQRAILHVDDEVDGDSHSYDDDYGWYDEMIQKISHATMSNSGDKSEGYIGLSELHCCSLNSNCTNHERWIDRCLDVCGYAISLDVAVDCLRKIVHHSKDIKTGTSSSDKLFEWNQKEIKCPDFSEAVRSLRTIRRRLLLIPASDAEEEFNLISFPRPYQRALCTLSGILNSQRLYSKLQCLILPWEYSQNRQSSLTRQTQSSSDSLSSVAMSVLPTLISSACYAKQLCLPLWAKPTISLGILLQSAWKSVLIGELFGSHALAETHVNATSNLNLTVSKSASLNFQLLVRQLIESGRSSRIARQLHKCWKTSGNNHCPLENSNLQTPRSIFCRHMESIIGSITSKREVAMFAQTIVRYIVKHELPNSLHKCHLGKAARNSLHDRCKTDCLPILRDLLPSIAKDAELAEAVVQFMILSPPTSFSSKIDHQTQTFPCLAAVDQVVPWCLVQLLAPVGTSTYNEGGGMDEDFKSLFKTITSDVHSDKGDTLSRMEANTLLSHVSAVASVWCEHVFVTRTDILQQQYVTEFILHPLECKLLTQEDLQSFLDDGITLAANLVQGVSLRLDVSQSESVRIDGMRVAEALALVLGQTVRFDELHQSEDADFESVVDAIVEKETCRKGQRKNTGKRLQKRKGSVMVDPDALVPSDIDSHGRSSDSDSSVDSHDEDSAFDSLSSWGEDSLQAYEMDDDEEDLRRVPRPRNLRECLAYLISTENDDLVYDRHQSALIELVPIVSAQPLDLHDVHSVLLRVLLHLEDKFNMDQFSEKRWNCLLTLGMHAPYETCVYLVGEMKESFSVRLEALFLVRRMAQELANLIPHRHGILPSNDGIDQEICRCSTKLQRTLEIRDVEGGNKMVDVSQSSKTRRWRKHRIAPTTTPNRFGPISVQMIYCMFTFLSQTRCDELIWGGSTGEKFLSEFLNTLSIMLNCSRTYPSSALKVLALDLLELAWCFRDAVCAEVRNSALLAVLTCVSVLPVEDIIHHALKMSSYLKQCSLHDNNADCRYLASLIAGSLSERISKNLIGQV